MSDVSQPGVALITGASSGIGAAYARQLAARGHGLILVARRADRLRELAESLTKQHGVSVETLEADLATEAGMAAVEQRLAACEPLTMLVNNAGFGSGGLYYQTNAVKQFAMIQVHVMAPARLIRAALPGLVRRGRGAVINVASIAAFAMVPTSAMYSSTKSWMVGFTRAIAAELEGTGVRAQALCPGFTRTEFHDAPEYRDFDRRVVPAFMWMTPDAVVAASLRALERNRVICIPGWFNWVMATFVRLPPVAALARVYGKKRWRKAK
jgi:short-subunit dehydrogenase